MHDVELSSLFESLGPAEEVSAEHVEGVWQQMLVEFEHRDLDERDDGPKVDYVLEPDESTLSDESTTLAERKRRTRVLASVAALILIVAGVAVVVNESSDDVVTGPATPADEGDAVPSPSVVESLGYEWSRAPRDAAVFGGGAAMDGVTAGGPGLVAVGSSFDSAAVWTSVDGLAWARVPDDGAVFVVEEFQAMSGVAAGGPGLVAVGWSGADLTGDLDAAVWTSADGSTWSRVPHDEAVFGGAGGQWMSDVVAGGPGLVAVGWEGDQYAGTAVAAVWTSADGLSWSRVPHDEAVFGGARNQLMKSVTAGGPGLVAVGSDGDLHGPGREDSPAEILAAAVWTSVDGLTWSRVPHDESVFDGTDRQTMNSVAAGGPGLVAVGHSGGSEGSIEDERAMVWTSEDGFTWSQVPHDAALFTGSEMTSVTATSQGLVVVGESDRPVVWTSPDGFNWSLLPHDEAVFGGPGNNYPARNHLNRVIAAEPGVVAVGQAPGGYAAVWVGVAEN